jgi:hypothetical protein
LSRDLLSEAANLAYPASSFSNTAASTMVSSLQQEKQCPSATFLTLPRLFHAAENNCNSQLVANRVL